MRRRVIVGIMVALGAGAAAGCSSDQADPIFKNMPTGPRNETLVDELPNDLRGDRENANHSGSPDAPPELRPADAESSGGEE